jgi:subtilisin family serine protease
VLASIASFPGASVGTSGQEPQPSEVVPAGAAEGGNLWFVELTGPPVADGASAAQVRNEKAAFRRAAAEAGVRFQERHAFDSLWNGFSVRINSGEVGRLSRIAGVKAVYPVATVAIPDREPAESPDLFHALAMTGVDIARGTLGLSGEGVKVAVMDTGIDYQHPALGGGFGPGFRVITGFDFVGDAFNSSGTTESELTPVPDPNPDDCNGHGTHVAGIIGGDGDAPSPEGPVRLQGVAPGVTFGAYKVFGCEGSTTADIMIAAMERAFADGMDVLNMSIGAAFQWPQYPTAQASDRLVNRGMVVVASAGNSGGSGIYSMSAPSVGKNVISVASFDNTHNRLLFFTASPDGAQIGYNQAAEAPTAPITGTFELARTGTATSTADACAQLPAGSLAGKVALIRRGTCTFNVKAFNAQNAGAAAVVIYNNVAGLQSITVLGPPTITIPVVSISAAQGVLLDGRLATARVDGTWTNQLQSFPSVTGNLISSFSSYGLSPDLALKPDIGAPGGSIYSTVPLEQGAFANNSGTSMSSPHVAGAVALLLQARPDVRAKEVRTILQNTAEPRLFSLNPGLGFFEVAHRQGAGMLQIDDAIRATTVVQPSKLSLGESQAGPSTHTLTVRNDSAADVTYTLSHVPALSTGANTFAPGFFTGFAAVAFSTTTLTVSAGGSATVDVTITANAALGDRSVYGGYIVLTPQAGGAVSRVPYAGFKGDYQSIEAMPRRLVRAATPVPPVPALTVPALARLDGEIYLQQGAGATFTLAPGDRPSFLFHLAHQVRTLRIEIRDAVTGKSWHRVFDATYFGRNSASTGFFALDWDGTTVAGRKQFVVPDGQYVAIISVLKALGDDDNPAHWESFTSPAFNITRIAQTTP